ncbi:hypothetical protein ABVT39_021457 [Epinephelus coioides]
MNLRSGGASKDSAEIKFKENIKKEKSEKNAKGMVEKCEIQQLFGQLKDSLTEEFKELRVELKEFRQDTERDIKTIMQQTADLLNNLDLIVTRVNQLETRVSSLDDTEIINQKKAEAIISRVDELIEQMDYLENKSRQNNVCIYNVAEKSEGTDMTSSRSCSEKSSEFQEIFIL